MKQTSLYKTYKEMESGDKGRFCRHLCTQLDISEASFYNKIKNDKWKPGERYFLNKEILPKLGIKEKL